MYFSSASDCCKAADALQRMEHLAIVLNQVEVDDDGPHWAEHCQANLHAIRIDRLVVAPPWDVPTDLLDASLIIIRPSMGFGTGHHASTRLCLRALQNQPVTGATVLDLGTGSGVLAIAAVKLGATSVLAIDSDDDALRCAQDNVTTNRVSSVVRIAAADIRHAPISNQAEVVVANLTGELLVRTAATIESYTTRGGRLIVSGFTSSEIDQVERAFVANARVRRRLCEQEWACLDMILDPVE